MEIPVRDVAVVHYHEIGLKGRNRSFFEQALVKHIRAVTGLAVRRLPGRLLVELGDDADPGAVDAALAATFGVANYALGRGGRLDLERICTLSLDMVARHEYETFAVRARRAHSDFPFAAREINEKVGAYLVEHTGKRVNLTRPDLTCAVEVVGDLAVVSTERKQGPGGLPVGVSGRVAALLSGGFDSPVAAARLMKRGSRVTFVHFHSQPYTDGSSVRHATELAALLTRFQLASTLYLVPLAPAQKVIAEECPQSLRTILYRRMMMRIAGVIAERDGAKALVTGDSLGQVASQTIENIAAVEDAATIPVLRPLIGSDKTEIIAESQRLGLYDVSSAPCQEACVLFEPKQPATKAAIAAVRAAEEPLDIEALVAAAASAAEAKTFRHPAGD